MIMMTVVMMTRMKMVMVFTIMMVVMTITSTSSSSVSIRSFPVLENDLCCSSFSSTSSFSSFKSSSSFKSLCFCFGSCITFFSTLDSLKIFWVVITAAPFDSLASFREAKDSIFSVMIILTTSVFAVLTQKTTLSPY